VTNFPIYGRVRVRASAQILVPTLPSLSIPTTNLATHHHHHHPTAFSPHRAAPAATLPTVHPASAIPGRRRNGWHPRTHRRSPGRCRGGCRARVTAGALSYSSVSRYLTVPQPPNLVLLRYPCGSSGSCLKTLPDF
jgi:hypothetical protein